MKQLSNLWGQLPLYVHSTVFTLLLTVVLILGVAYLTVTSEYVPPNPRLLITGFPIVVVYARYLDGRRFKWLCAVMTVLLIELSGLTFVGITLRP